MNGLSHSEFRGRIGFARTAITPPAGIYARLWGSAKHDLAEGVHQPMLATCMILDSEQGVGELVLISFDAVALWQEEIDRIRNALIGQFGLQARQLMLHASHTHSSPMLSRRHADRPGGHLIAPYLDSLPERVCAIVSAARADLFPGTLSWSYGTCSLAFNRDALDPASGRGVCGLNPARAADHTLLVGRATDRACRIRGVIVNYACHPVSLGGANKLLSPDYVGPMRALVEREAGGLCLFLHGASGNLTPRRSYEAGTDAAEQNGRELGFAALTTLSGMLPPGRRLDYSGIEESGTALGVWKSTDKADVCELLEAKTFSVQLRLKQFPPREQVVAELEAAKEPYLIERLDRALAMRDRIGSNTVGSLLVTLWRAGDAFLIATTGEPYSEFQVALRNRFPDSAVAVLNLTNGATSYLPEAAAYGMDVYPVRVTEFASGCLEQAIEQTISAVLRLQERDHARRA